MPLAIQSISAIPSVEITDINRVEISDFANSLAFLRVTPGKSGQDLTGLTAEFKLITTNSIVTLTDGDGLTKTSNDVELQVFEVLITIPNKALLLGELDEVVVRWELSVTLTGGAPITGDEGTPYTGELELVVGGLSE